MNPKNKAGSAVKETSPSIQRVNSEKRICGLISQEKLGSGASGEVFLVKDNKTNEAIALKVRKYSNDIDQNNLIEPILLRSFDSACLLHAIKLYDSKDCGDSNIGYTLPLGRGDLLTAATELRQQYFLAYCAMEGIHCMHSSGFLHGDIKPENLVVFDRYQSKIIDFGLSLSLDTRPKYNRLLYTWIYRAPELLEAKMNTIELRYSADIWALGVLFLDIFGISLVHKDLFYEDQSKTKVYLRKLYNTVNVNIDPNAPVVKNIMYLWRSGWYYDFIIKSIDHKVTQMISPQEILIFKDLVLRMLNLDPSKRPSIQEVKLNPFFNHVRLRVTRQPKLKDYSRLLKEGECLLKFTLKPQLSPNSVTKSIITELLRRVKVLSNYGSMLASEFFIMTDIVYLICEDFKIDNPSLIIQDAYDLKNNIIGFTDYTVVSRTASVTKKQFVIKHDGKVYRRHLFHYSRSISDLAYAYKYLISNPEEYIKVDKAPEWFVQCPINPNVELELKKDKYSVTMTELLMCQNKIVDTSSDKKPVNVVINTIPVSNSQQPLTGYEQPPMIPGSLMGYQQPLTGYQQQPLTGYQQQQPLMIPQQPLMIPNNPSSQQQSTLTISQLFSGLKI